KLLLLLDESTSMNIVDEFNTKSRWEHALRLLKAPSAEALLKQLQQEQKVELVFYQAAEDARKFEPAAKATGKRTNMGQWLHTLRRLHGGEQNLRGLLLFSDGADNGNRFPTLEEAAHFRGIPCPVHTFAVGSPTTNPKQHDI